MLPRGWTDFGRQLAIWFGFYLSYFGARSLADRNPAQAFWNGWRVLTFEQRTTHHLVEVSAQQLVDSSNSLLTAAAWTYWNSEFTVVGLALLWVYIRHHEHFARFRNTVLLANVARARRLRRLADRAPVDVHDVLPERREPLERRPRLLRQPVCGDAEPPRRRRAHRRRVPLRHLPAAWAKAALGLWPAWVWFCVLATANHFLLDVLAGICVAVISILHGLLPRRPAPARARPLIANLL